MFPSRVGHVHTETGLIDGPRRGQTRQTKIAMLLSFQLLITLNCAYDLETVCFVNFTHLCNDCNYTVPLSAVVPQYPVEPK